MLSLLAAAGLAICAPGPRDNCVVDGDTFWVQGVKVRIADIDAPEINGHCGYERRLAIKSRDRLLALLNAGPFQLRTQGKDRFGRTLALVTRDGVSIGEVLVKEGLARVWKGRREPWC